MARTPRRKPDKMRLLFNIENQSMSDKMIWDGRDAVWPTPATAEKAEKYLRLENKGQ